MKLTINSPRKPVDNHDRCMSAAQAAISSKDYRSAENYLRKALAVKKKSAVALASLGQCLCHLNRINEGIPYLCQAGKVLLTKAKVDRNLANLLDLAYQLIHWHAPEEALIFAKACVHIDSKSANANYIAALGFQGLNRFSEAYPWAVRAVDLAPQESNAIILLAVLESKLDKLDDARHRLERLVDTVSDHNTARAHMELGIILDKAEDYDGAFKHLTESGKINLASRGIRAIDKKAVYRDVREYKKSFNRQFIQSTGKRVLADDLPSPVFLIGFYRSGTTLAEQILAAHSQVVTSDETHIITHVLNEILKITSPSMTLPERIKALDSDQITYLRRHYWDVAVQTLGQGILHKVLVDKTAMNTLNVELINILFPNAIIIFAVRDPRDVCLSCFMQPFAISSLTVHFLSWEEGARFYDLIMNYWLSVRDSLSLRWVELRYEDVLDDLELQFRPIFAKMGLDWSAECSEFYRHSQQKIIKTPSFDQVTRPLYTTSRQRWRNYETHFQTVLPILDTYIKVYGYETPFSLLLNK